jgi:hypothetical protein
MVNQTGADSPIPPRPRFTRRQVLMQVLIGVVILISGMGIGTGGTILVLRDRIIWRFPQPPDRRPGPPDIVKMWQTDYGLTDDQVSQARQVLATSMATTQTFWKELQQKEQAERQKFAESMKDILTPEQYQKWENDFVERMKQIERRRPGWHPGWRPGSPGGRSGGRPGGRDGDHKDRGSFRGDRGFRPPPGPRPAPGERGLPPGPNAPGNLEPGPGPKPE